MAVVAVGVGFFIELTIGADDLEFDFPAVATTVGVADRSAAGGDFGRLSPSPFTTGVVDGVDVGGVFSTMGVIGVMGRMAAGGVFFAIGVTGVVGRMAAGDVFSAVTTGIVGRVTAVCVFWWLSPSPFTPGIVAPAAAS